MPEINNTLGTSISLYVIMAVPVLLLVWFFVKYPKAVIDKRKRSQIQSAKVNDRVVTRHDGEGIILSVDSYGLYEIKLEKGKVIQYAWWAIDKIIE